jgi:hypothetical protein
MRLVRLERRLDRSWLALAGVLCLAAGVVTGGQTPAPVAASLSDAFALGRFVEDRSGDGWADTVTARVVTGENPTPAVVAAAADIAGRLGLETMAMNLPLSRQTSGRVIAVGDGGLAQAGIPRANLGLGTLGAGEGTVVATTAAGAPALAVLGADDAGLGAAASLLAGRLPNLWEPRGATLGDVETAVRDALDGAGITPRATHAAAVHVAAGAQEVERVVVTAAVSSAADQRRARTALTALRAAGASEDDRARLSWPAVRTLEVRLQAEGAADARVDLARSKDPDPGPLGRRPGAGAKESLDLSSLYANEGMLGDSDSNLIPDRVDVLLVPSGEGTLRTIDVAARLGLEAAGLTVPLARPAEAITRPESEPTLVLIGLSHPLVDTLVAGGKFERPALAPGQGLIQVVRKAWGDKSAVIVTGGDAAGLDRALEQLAERLPHVWQRGKDRPTLDDVEDELRRALGGRTPLGQAATALYKLNQIGGTLAGRNLESVRVSVHVEKADAGLAAIVEQEAARLFPSASREVVIDNLDVQNATPIDVNGRSISEEIEIPSEVDEFWQVFRSRVLPAVRRRQPVTVDARLSESPELRRRLEADAREALLKAGAAPTSSVRILSAYKQGFSWMDEVVKPALEGQPVRDIVIRFAEIGPPPEWQQQAMYAPTRWLLEAFPIDEVLARDLTIGLDRIRFEQQPIGAPAYEVIATAPDGREIYRETFEPKFVVRPYFDRFPDYEKVRVTTGWITASVQGRQVVDQRIVTDPERFWDHFQAVTLPAIYDYVMGLSDGAPRPEDAPHFGELTVDLTLSEPEYQLGIDKEHISPMESLHEEIYFGVLHFFDVLGRTARGPALDYPGRIIPIVRPKDDGRPGVAKISFTGFAANRPAVQVAYRSRDGRSGTERLDVPKIAVERPQALAAWVRAGQPGLERLDLRLKVDTDRDEREALIRRTSRQRVDTTILSAEQVEAVIASVVRLREAGLYRSQLAWPHLGEVRLAAGWTHDRQADAERVAILRANGQPAPLPDITRLLPAGWRHTGGQLVQWDTPIPPPEAAEILAKMSTFPEATVYKLGESYLGKDIWAMDLMPPIEATHWSQAKATTLKPTVIYSARQHANEVSSTSHVLRLAEMLLTDPAFREQLKKVNVVVHPITNPDGAQLAYDLYRITPDHMLHAGYLGSLGVDVTAHQWQADAIYPESGLRPKIWRTWLPDIFLNPHGYPSHEWVQLFSEYAGWVRSRTTESRDWWGMRGWFIPGFGYLDDPRYPRHKDAAFDIRSRITRNMNSVPDIRALNDRAYARYQRYGFDHDDENFKLDFTDDILIYTAIKGSRANPTAGDFMSRQPNITIWTGGTEAPDETAYGEWMTLVATMGLQWNRAILEYLVEGNHKVERRGESFWGGSTITLSRARPPQPEESTDTTSSAVTPPQ